VKLRWWHPAIVRHIASTLEIIMAQLDDLRAVLQASNEKIVEVAARVDEVQADVQDLLDRMGQVSPPIPADIMESAARLQSSLNAVKDDLDTTPKAPPQA
jgi:hypothetical protein